MALSRFAAAGVVVVVVLAACGADPDTGPALTRVLLPPVDPAPVELAAPTTSTTARLDAAEADRAARTELSAVLAAAELVYAGKGTFDAGLAEVAQLVPGVTLIALEDAAARDGVVYDSHDQRLTLHRRSAGGRWFCLDRTGDVTDYGYGDTFPESLDACTDGDLGNGWEDTQSATGPNEGAIDALFRSLSAALGAGDGATAFRLFDPPPSCSEDDLQAVWPEGLVLADPADVQLESVRIAGAEATAVLSIGEHTESAWPLVKGRDGWRHGGDPCSVFGPLAADLMETAAAGLLDQALFAVRSAFVRQSDFAFTPSVLAEIDPDLELVDAAELGFGSVFYAGSEGRGLLVTAGAPGRFHCAVESLSHATVYGAGQTIGEVDSPNRCVAHAVS